MEADSFDLSVMGPVPSASISAAVSSVLCEEMSYQRAPTRAPDGTPFGPCRPTGVPGPREDGIVHFMRETIISTPRMSLYFHPVEKVIHHEMHSYPGLDTLEQVLLGGLEVMKERNAVKWLSDDRKGGALPKSHHEWGDTVWAPQAAKAGWRYWALLPPADALGSANMKRLVKVYAKRGIVVEMFGDTEEAMDWLRRQSIVSLAKAT